MTNLSTHVQNTVPPPSEFFPRPRAGGGPKLSFVNSASQDSGPTNTNNAPPTQSQPGPSGSERQSQFRRPDVEPQAQQQRAPSTHDRRPYHHSFQPQEQFNPQTSTSFEGQARRSGSQSFGSQSRSFRDPSYSFNGQSQSFGGAPSNFTSTSPNFTHTYPTSNSQEFPHNQSPNFPFDLNEFAELVAKIVRSEISQPRPTIS